MENIGEVMKEIDEYTIVIKYANGQTNVHYLNSFEEFFDHKTVVRKIFKQQNYEPNTIKSYPAIFIEEVKPD